MSDIPSAKGKTRLQRQIEDHQRQDRALALAATGATYQQVADVVGYASPQTAATAVKAALDRQPASDVRLFRQLQLEQIQRITRGLWAIAQTTYFAIDRGNVVMYDGAPVIDPSHNLAAYSKLITMQERVAKLEGMDAPTRHQVAVLTPELLDEALSQVSGERRALEQERRALLAESIDAEVTEDD